MKRPSKATTHILLVSLGTVLVYQTLQALGLTLVTKYLNHALDGGNVYILFGNFTNIIPFLIYPAILWLDFKVFNIRWEEVEKKWFWFTVGAFLVIVACVLSDWVFARLYFPKIFGNL